MEKSDRKEKAANGEKWLCDGMVLMRKRRNVYFIIVFLLNFKPLLVNVFVTTTSNSKIRSVLNETYF